MADFYSQLAAIKAAHRGADTDSRAAADTRGAAIKPLLARLEDIERRLAVLEAR